MDILTSLRKSNLFSTTLRNLRIQNNISKRALAKKTGIAYTTIVNWENSSCEPGLYNVMALHKAIPLPLWKFFGEDGICMNADEMAILKAYRKLGDGNKSKLKHMLRIED